MFKIFILLVVTKGSSPNITRKLNDFKKMNLLLFALKTYNVFWANSIELFPFISNYFPDTWYLTFCLYMVFCSIGYKKQEYLESRHDDEYL